MLSQVGDQDTAGHTTQGLSPWEWAGGIFILLEARGQALGVWGVRGGKGLLQWEGRALTDGAWRHTLTSRRLPPIARRSMVATPGL